MSYQLTKVFKEESRVCSIVGGGFNPKEWTFDKF